MLNSIHRAAPDPIVSRLRAASTILLDVDGTITGPHGGVRERILDTVPRLGLPVGLATARSLGELEAAFPRGVACEEVFRGHVLIEDGAAVAVRSGGNGRGLVVESCVEPISLSAVDRFREAFLDSLRPLDSLVGLCRIEGVTSAFVKLPPYRDFVASVSIWQRTVDERGASGTVRGWCEAMIEQLGLTQHLATLELNDGTVRVTVKGIDKGSGLERLSAAGRLDLGSVAYFGDGLNDVPAARVIKRGGGLVIAVGRTTPELVALADYVTAGQGSRGVERLLGQLLRT